METTERGSLGVVQEVDSHRSYQALFQCAGPPAHGWPLDGYFYECSMCRTGFVAEALRTYVKCRCGKMLTDPDAGRFGHDLGDQAILTWRIVGGA